MGPRQKGPGRSEDPPINSYTSIFSIQNEAVRKVNA